MATLAGGIMLKVKRLQEMFGKPTCWARSFRRRWPFGDYSGSTPEAGTALGAASFGRVGL